MMVFAVKSLNPAAAAAAGSLSYVVLYLAKSYVTEAIYLRNPMETVLVKLGTKAISSLTNAAIAVVVTCILAPIFRRAMRAAHFDTTV